MQRSYNFTGPILLLAAVVIVVLAGSLVGSLETATPAETKAFGDLVLFGVLAFLTLSIAAFVSAIRRGG